MSEEFKRCPKCRSWQTEFKKSWKIKSPLNDSEVKVNLWHCKMCRKNFRVYE